MNLDLRPFFSEYESLVAQVDAVFKSVCQKFPAEVTCRKGCGDCCHALFDVTLVEAMYLNARFAAFDDVRRNEILVEADKAERKAQLVKKQAYRDVSSTSQADILTQAAKERIRCPLLDAADTCSLYASRPITCRIYGIPMEIEGVSHTCGLSGFEPGKPYPSIKVARIQDRLVELSNRLLAAIGTPYQDFQYMHVPVSAALLTVYSDDFFGLKDSTERPLAQSGTADA